MKNIPSLGRIVCSMLFLFLFSFASYSQTTIWQEDFDSYANGTTSGTGSPAIASWSADGGARGVDVRNSRIRGRNTNSSGRYFWTIDPANPIEISGYTNVTITLNVWENGELENADFVQLQYSLNGGGNWVNFATNGRFDDDFGSAVATQSGLSGSELLIRGEFVNNADAELYFIDNILVVGTPTPVATLPTGNDYYSYQSGAWNDPSTWTHDPGGTTHTATDIPHDGDNVHILNNRTVYLTENVDTANLKIQLRDVGILDQSTFQFTNGIESLSGQGFHKLASANYPTVTANSFVEAGGGTTEYNAAVNLPTTQDTYNNLTINAGGTVTQLSDITLNGNLHIKQGTYQINDASANRRKLTISGDVVVDNGTTLTIGSGRTTTTTNPTGISGGTAPFTNYYDQQSHRIVVNGDFTNNGTVTLTDQTYPVFNALPTTGIATVYFSGASDNTLTCNGTTNFYNIVLDKGIDQSYTLTVNSTTYNNFKLLGANSAAGEGGGANPNLRKALWIRTGTLELKGLVVIPSLTEGGGNGTPNSDFYIPVNAGLLITGPEVVVLTTADDYTEVNAAYGLTGGSNAAYGVSYGGNNEALSIYGKLQVNDGYLSTRESGGINTWDVASGDFILKGGTVDTKQLKSESGSNGLISYIQNGGTIIFRGRHYRNFPTANNVEALINASLNTGSRTNGLDASKATFSIEDASNIFSMTAGTVQILDVCGSNGYAFDVFSEDKNINVTGGTVEFLPQVGNTTFQVRSKAPLGNITINREAASSSQVRLNANAGAGVSGALSVVGDVNITRGLFNANNYNLSVGGDFTIESNGSYQTGNNSTIFNGTHNQLFTVNTPGTLALKKLKVDKPAGSALDIAGSQSTISVQDSLAIIEGELNDGGKTILFTTSSTSTTSVLYNSGVHSGAGVIELADNDPQVIAGDGTGIFQNIELNNNDGLTAPVSLAANITINGELTFSRDKLFDIGTNNVTFGTEATVVNAGTNRFMQTSGSAGDGGVTKEYSATSTGFTFPIGAISTRHSSTAYYTPSTISFGAQPSVYGAITVNPVGYEHPNTTNKGRSLTYYWRVKSSGFTLGSATVNHSYVYSQNDVVTGGNISEAGYVAASYENSTYTWTKEASNDVNESTNTIGGNGTAYQSLGFIDGEFTAGDDNPTDPFGAPTIYYSRQSGLWGSTSTWSLTDHTTNNPPSTVPGINDIVIIGGNDSIYLNSNLTWANADVRSCATLKIEEGSALDIGYNPGCNFVTVLGHANGNGIFRLTCDRGPLSWSTVRTFQFPSGDFSDFNQNLGTTELYTTNNVSGTTFYLPDGVTSYGNLVVSPLGGSNIIFANHDLLIYGNLVTRGQNADSWFCSSWYNNYPGGITRVAKTITVLGDLDIQGGGLVWYGNGNITQDWVIYGDVIVAPNSAIDVWGDATSQSIAIGGNLINNTVGTTAWGTSTPRYCDFRLLPVTFFGEGTARVTNTQNTPLTYFETVIVNKGSSRSDSLIIDIGGTLSTPSDNWLTLENGTLRYERNSNFTITTSSPFVIPTTAELYIDAPGRTVYLANANSNNNDVYLNGKLTIEDGNVRVGNTNNYNQDIEYSGDGFSEIDIQNGTLMVNGQIRRNPSSTSGILKYNQSGGTLTVNGRNALTSNAKLEVLNSGSEFNMSAGTINIIRGGGGSTYGDLYLRPGSSTVTGGEIVFSPGTVGDQDYILDATCSLWDLTINGSSGNDANVELLVSPLTVENDLHLVTSTSTLDVNSTFNIPVTINGDFNNSGVYNHYDNLTTFNGGEQYVLGASATTFYDLSVNSVTSLSLNKDATILNDLSLSSGTLICDNYTVEVKGDVVNNAAYTDNNSGIVLNGNQLQYLSGTGSWGQLELDNVFGARLGNSITLQKDFLLTNGILDINRYLFSLSVGHDIVGSNFSEDKMITSDGVYSDVGVRKFYGIYSGAEITDSIPIGTGGLYTPVAFSYTDNTNVGYIRFNNINSAHPGAIDPNNVLDYFWEVESSGMAGVNGSLVFHYYDEDVQVTGSNSEANYIAAGLLLPGTTWTKASPGPSTDNVDENLNKINFNYSSSSSLSGEYTAGIDPALPDNVPQFISINDGDWTDASNWQQVGGDPYTLTGAPNGFIVTIDTDDEVTLNADYALAYRTEINGTLRVVQPYYGHNLGTVSGDGTIYLESGAFPAGKYGGFLDCSNNATLEYGGTGTYTIDAYLYSSVPNLLFTGTGTRVLPNDDLTVCNQLLIDGPTLDNSVYNRTLTILGTMERTSGSSFLSGTGDDATVRFAGGAAQTVAGALGDFSGTNRFNNLEIDNTDGLTVNSNGQVEVKGNLLLTNGLITTSNTNTLTITNTDEDCVYPAGGSSSSYIDGPLTKSMHQGNEFDFPVGKGSMPGNRIKLTAVKTGTQNWTVEYFNPNSTAPDRAAPLTYVNNDDYWTVTSAPGNRAKINLDWEPYSDLTPLMTENGVSDMRVVKFNTTSSLWEEQTSNASGDFYNGTVWTSNRVTIPASGASDFSIGCVNIIKARAQLNPTGPVCGTAGIPVSFTFSSAIPLDYLLDYTVNGVAQPQITITSADLPYTLPTPVPGVYKLTSFRFDGGSAVGVVDPTTVEAFALPTIADAGADQSLCGLATTALEGNSPVVGTGLWSITSGDGGSVVAPTLSTSDFNGINGNDYTLNWTITNGGCTSSDEVSISFPLLPVQPEEFTAGPTNICAGQQDVIYTVPEDATVTYSWSYTGSGETITGTGNSVEIDFGLAATSGILGVNATNGCGTSVDRIINITVTPVPTITSTTDASICGSGTITLGASSSAGDVNWYSASTGGSSLNTGTSYTTPVLSANTSYFVDATDGLCTSDSRTEVFATVQTPAAANAGSDEAVCEDVTFNLSTSGTVPSASDHNGLLWATSGDGSFNNNTLLLPVYTPGSNDISNGSVELILTAIGNSPCGNVTDTMELTINSLPNVTITCSDADSTFCEGETVVLDAGAGGASYTWSTTATSQSIDVTGVTPTLPAVSYTATYSVTVETTHGCQNSDDITITVFRRPQAGPVQHIDNNLD